MNQIAEELKAHAAPRARQAARINSARTGATSVFLDMNGEIDQGETLPTRTFQPLFYYNAIHLNFRSRPRFGEKRVPVLGGSFPSLAANFPGWRGYPDSDLPLLQRCRNRSTRCRPTSLRRDEVMTNANKRDLHT